MSKVIITLDVADTSEETLFLGLDCEEPIEEITIDGAKLEEITKMHQFRKAGEHKVAVKFDGAVCDCFSMFSECRRITGVKFVGFDTSACTSMEEMFCNCAALRSLDLSGFDTAAVESMDGMFMGCKSLSSLNISSFDTKHNCKFGGIFDGCASLRDVKFGKNCANLQEIYELTMLDYEPIDIKDNNNNNNNKQIIEIEVKANKDGEDLRFLGSYRDCTMLYDRLSKARMYIDGKPAEFTNHCKFNKGEHVVKFEFSYDLKTCRQMFYACDQVTGVKFINFVSQHVQSMECMFWGCSRLKNIEGLSTFNTKSTKNMSGMFHDCRSLKNINLSSFNTKSNKNLSRMFQGCRALKSLELSAFDTSNTYDMSEMVNDCPSLSYLNLLSLDTSRTKDVSQMLGNCLSLKAYLLRGDFRNSLNVDGVTDTESCYEGVFVVLNQSRYKKLNIPKRFKRLKIHF